MWSKHKPANLAIVGDVFNQSECSEVNIVSTFLAFWFFFLGCFVKWDYNQISHKVWGQFWEKLAQNIKKLEIF
jgi:hypothetical protein